MPQVRKLAPEEVQELQNKGKGPRKLVEQEYDVILSDYEVGEYGEAILDVGENRLTVRNRLKAAANRRGVGINFRRTSGDLLRFQVVDRGDQDGSPDILVAEESLAVVSSDIPPMPEPVTEPAPAPARRKGGRPKKAVSS